MKRDDIRLKVIADPRVLSAIRGLVRGYVENLGLNPDKADEIVLAVDEACTNSIRHAYQGRKDAVLELTLRSDPQWIQIVLRDQGKPAPKEALERKDITQPDAAAVQPGGLGIQLIHRAFDAVTFRPGKERGNRVTMRVKRHGKHAPSRNIEEGDKDRPEWH